MRKLAEHEGHVSALPDNREYYETHTTMRRDKRVADLKSVMEHGVPMLITSVAHALNKNAPAIMKWLREAEKLGFVTSDQKNRASPKYYIWNE